MSYCYCFCGKNQAVLPLSQTPQFNLKDYKLCRACKLSVHKNCLGRQQVEPDMFYCPWCDKSTQMDDVSESDIDYLCSRFNRLKPNLRRLAMIRGYRERPTRQDSIEHSHGGDDDDEQVGEIEKIIKYRAPSADLPSGSSDCPERMFLTKFKSDPCLYWQPESSFQAGVTILNDFLRAKNLPLTYLRNKVGSSVTRKVATTGTAFNPEAWIEPEQLLKVVRRFKKVRAYSSSIRVELVTDYQNANDGAEEVKSSPQDAIYILVKDNHCYIILDLPGESRSYISDGLNLSKDLTIHDCLLPLGRQELLARHLVPVEFKQQRCVDYCGSSAAIILLEFKRIYRSRVEGQPVTMPTHLSAPRGLLKDLVGRLHGNNQSNIVPTRTRESFSIANWSMTECRFNCGRKWRKITKLGLRNHERACKGREIEHPN